MPGESSITGVGSRIAIVGAGPAGCLVAGALLDAAAIRGQELSISLYGAGVGSSGDEILLVDDAALSHLAAAGLPSPSLTDHPITRLRVQAGKAATEADIRWFSVLRDEVVGGLRACAAARGVRLVQRRVEELTRTVDGGWILRANGASERADRIILACGAGASIAGRLPGHQPPPLWRGCVASLDVDPQLAQHLAGKVLRIQTGGHPELSVVSSEARATVYAAGADVGPRELGLALLAASAAGALPGRFVLRGIRRQHAPGGVANPGQLTVGAALGGLPACSLLGRAGDQAQRLAAAFFDGDLLDISKREAVRLRGALQGRQRLARSLRRFGEPALEAALRVPREADAPLPRLIAEVSSPRLQGASPPREVGLRDRVAAFLHLLLAFLLVGWRRLFGPAQGEASPRPPPNRMVYVVEDDPDCAALVGAALDERRIPYRHFTNGIEAAAMAPLDRPAAIVLDVVLPWIDGVQLSHTLRAGGDVSIVWTTSLPRSSWTGKRAPGADPILTKPLDLAVLAARVDRCLPPVAPADPGAARRID